MNEQNKPLLIYSLDLHKNPDKDEWAVSFIYDEHGEDSEEGDIIEVGSHEDMEIIYNRWEKIVRDIRPEYFAFIKIFPGNKE